MECNLNDKYCVTRENFVLFINRLCNKRAIKIQISKDENDFDIIKKLNKILINLKMKKLTIGINILDEEIQNLIPLNKENFCDGDLEKIFIYFYFYNSINDLDEFPKMLNDPKIKWQIIKQILSDYNLDKRYSYIDGELYLKK